MSFILPYKGRFYVIIVLTVVLGILTAVRPLLILRTLDDDVAHGDYDSMVKGMLLVFALLVIQSIFQYVHTYLSGRIGQYVIRDSETWKNIWLRVRDSEIPIVDFEKKMVLAAFLGVRSTGGYSVKIEGIGKRKNKIVVAVREAKPPKNAMVIQAITSPYHIKVVDRSALPVEFKIVK